MNLKEKFILISKSNSFKYLVRGRKFKAGRNNTGRITVRHKGSKIKKKQRIIDNYRAI
jgi:large subunit ribosomal protein L2